jgi:CRP-like cAMP-binding protein
MNTLEPILTEHPFFEGLNPKYMKLLVGCAKNVRFDDGQFLFREGEPADQFFLIRHGKVALEMAPPNKSPLIVDTIEEGGVLGWSWLIPPFKWHFDALAQGVVRAISLDGKCLRNKFQNDHELGYEINNRFLQVVTSRLQQTRMQLMDVYGTQS